MTLVPWGKLGPAETQPHCALIAFAMVLQASADLLVGGTRQRWPTLLTQKRKGAHLGQMVSSPINCKFCSYLTFNWFSSVVLYGEIGYSNRDF